MNLNFDSRAFRAAPLLALAAALACAPVARAQEIAPPPTPNADQLAEEMRILGRDPRNVRALLSAGEASARLNDPSAAAGFFARAQALDPGNPRVKAGQAMVMVRMERPGEALRLFDQAARAGISMDAYASDRGLAYDLIGAQGHAQREHRVAMRLNPDDETRRRYALSLGISGDAAQANTILEPLLRRSDRAAWRARAFILAMNGDAAGADKIAASMMGGFGTALSPFFRRLPALPAADKAFAVHFGEIRRTPQRVDDASLAPPLPVLRGEPGVAVAAAQPARVPQPATTTTRREGRPSAAQRRQAERERLAQVERDRLAQVERDRLARQEADRREAQRLADLKAQQEREALAARQRETERLATEQATREAEARRVAELQAQQQRAAESARIAEAQRVAEAQRLAAAAPPPVASPPASSAASSSQTEIAAAAPVETPATSPAQTASAAASLPPQPAEAATVAAAKPPLVGREDNVIARIIAGITIPASELGVEPMPGERAPTEPQQPAPVAPVEAPTAAAPVQLARSTPVAPKPAVEKPRATEGAERAATKAKTADSKAVDTKAKTSAKPADAKAKAAEAKAAEAKAAAAKAKKPDPAKTDPSRIWVQVAGGANVGDLPKSWRALVAKAPAEFKGRQAWTTPLRFTNRLLTGPFKTSGEAQAFVNAVGKKGVSAFAFTSEAGQKIDKLPAN